MKEICQELIQQKTLQDIYLLSIPTFVLYKKIHGKYSWKKIGTLEAH